ncbi:MAG: DinB family protein [bacterium]|nr:DinB family protein [bacterium]
MIKQALLTQLGFTHYSITKNLEGITHADSLERPQNGGNGINWVLGHIVNSRGSFTKHFDADPPLDEASAKLYGRGAEPIGPGSDAVQLEELTRLLDASQERIAGLLQEADEAFLAVEVPQLFAPDKTQPRGVQFAAVLFHESYHAGQLGSIRGALGKGGAIQ